MRTIQPAEHYTDRGDFAVMTLTSVRKYAQLARIADHLCRNAEQLLFSTDQPTIDNCRIAGMMLGLAYNLVPPRIAAGFDY
ncbi:MAG: hypothetical protein ACLPY1_07280 [Terracidiphilus sp.]